MPNEVQEALDAWRAADTNARAAEAVLSNAWAAFDIDQGPPVESFLMEEVSRLRAIANDKLTVAMVLMGKR